MIELNSIRSTINSGQTAPATMLTEVDVQYVDHVQPLSQEPGSRNRRPQEF
jgi:hypothetical protein